MTDAIPQIFDRKLYLSRQASTIDTDILQNHIARELEERLSLILKQFPKVLLVDHRPDALVRMLKSSGKVLDVTAIPPFVGDTLGLPENIYHAAFSILDLHCVNDVPGYLAQLGRSLKPDGLLMVVFFAGETLQELRESWLHAEIEMTGGVTPRVAPMIGVRELGGLMQRAGLALPVADVDKIQLRYDGALALVRDIKKFGYANPLVGRSPKFVSGRLLASMAAHYNANFSDPDGRVRATLETAWAMAWRPHQSQPKPLKPGSASHRLADALKSQT